ncbi:hypothetical protein, partial [Shewanella chilikensis]|uniref:hypothetical protein n=1 Tax=Shewanella chilikensis TaxID=558541 RepID=UPI001E3535A1
NWHSRHLTEGMPGPVEVGFPQVSARRTLLQKADSIRLSADTNKISTAFQPIDNYDYLNLAQAL